jgi:hypothetical protein
MEEDSPFHFARPRKRGSVLLMMLSEGDRKIPKMTAAFSTQGPLIIYLTPVASPDFYQMRDGVRVTSWISIHPHDLWIWTNNSSFFSIHRTAVTAYQERSFEKMNLSSSSVNASSLLANIIT